MLDQKMAQILQNPESRCQPKSGGTHQKRRAVDDTRLGISNQGVTVSRRSPEPTFSEIYVTCGKCGVRAGGARLQYGCIRLCGEVVTLHFADQCP